MGAQLIDQSQKDDLLNGLEPLGYDRNEFVITRGTRSEVHVGSDKHAIVQEIVIYRDAENVRRTYKGGHGSAWAADALRDVEIGRFGRK